MPLVPRREFSNNAEPERLPDQWRMTMATTKGEHATTALLCTH